MAAWLGPNDLYCYLVNGTSGTSIVCAHPRTGDIREILSASGSINGLSYGPGGKCVRFKLGGDLYEILGAGESKRISLEQQSRFLRRGRRVGEEDLFELFSPDNTMIALLEGNAVKIVTTDDRRPVFEAVCTSSQTWELDAAEWSSDSRVLVLPRLDYEGVPQTPITWWLGSREKVTCVPETRTGEEYPVPSLVILHVTGQVVEVELSLNSGHIMVPVAWNTDDSEYLFLQTNRTMNALQVCAADSLSGRVRYILREESPTFIEGLRLYDIARDLLFQLEGGQHFIWLSERSGWHGLWLYQRDATLERLLTPPGLEVLRVLRQAPRTDQIFFLAHEQHRPYDTHLFRMGILSGEIRKLSNLEGQHYIDLSPSCEFYFDQHASLDRDPVTDLHAADGKFIRNVHRMEFTQAAALGSSYGEVREVVTKAADQETDLWGVLVLPSNFSEQKRYPVIDFIYNGPFITWAPRTRYEVMNGFSSTLAKAGFAVLVIDGRGTPERGTSFQDVVYRAFGRSEVDDHLAALQDLCRRHNFLDADRVGVCGGSWGGYMAIRAMLRYPGVYKAGVATNPVHDLINHGALGIEPYMGLPDQNPDGYREASNLRLVESLKGKLLIMHGTSDRNAPLIGTMKMVAELMLHGKDFDLKLFPDQNHAFEGALQSYWIEQTIKYFHQHLLV